MSSVCAEQHKFVPSRHILSPNKSLIRDIDIPPRKLLTRRPSTTHDVPLDMYSSDDTFLQKFLPRNNIVDSDDDDSDPYSSDHFRMYEFKVRRCTRSRSHDWTDCPFAHPGEKARRRDPRRYHYSGTVCPEYRRGGCSSGDGCEFAHGVFECWLHPSRYRTEACKDGKNCKRKVCFFAHTPRQLRILPVNSHNSSPDMSCKSNKFLNPASGSTNCCLFCHCAATSSPTSTLFGTSHSHFSPPLSPSNTPVSPPLSPVKRRSANGVSPISRYCDRFAGSETSGGLNRGVVSYKDALTELMSSLEGLNLIEVASPVSATKALNLPWLDVSLNSEDQQQQYILSPTTSFNCEDQLQQQQYILSPTTSFNCEDQQQQQQFILSPTTYFNCEDQQQQQFILSPTTSFINCEDQQQQFILSPSAQTTPATCVSASFSNDNGSSSCPAPDLGWVNELLM